MPKERKSSDTLGILHTNTIRFQYRRLCFMGSFPGNSVSLWHVDYCNTSSINSEGGKVLSTKLDSIPKQRERKTPTGLLES